jgi:tripeptidyl-peptidase-1
MPLSVVPKVRQSKATATAAGYNVASVKRAFGIPTNLKATNASTLQMVWGPGTFGYSETQLLEFKMTQCPLLNMKAISFDTKNHGKAGGDNYGEGNLDVSMIASYGLNVNTIVSNTNVSSSTEEGTGFGQAMLDFLIDLPTRATIPQVLSISLGSLSAYSCDLLCTEAVKMGHSAESCHSFMQSQRQVCMYMSEYQTDLIDTAFKLLAMRGVTVFGSSGDGGSHWSFEAFPSGTSLGRDLNTIGCKFQFPVYPTGSPYVTSVGGITWGDSPADPIAWDRSGGGFAWQFPRASFQDDAVTSYLKTAPGLPPFTSFNQSNRAYPDISAISLDGTSQSSPMVAGIFSLLMDYRLNQGLPPLGFLGPRLYQTMAKYPNEAFKDVTDGNSKTTCDNGFPATRGWDPVTGWGSPLCQGIKEHFGTDSNIAKLGL